MILLPSDHSLETYSSEKMYIIDTELMLDASGKHYIKEFTLVEAEFHVEEEPVVLLHELICPPCAWTDLPRRVQSRCTWLTRHYHGHTFAYGHITLDQLRIELNECVPTPGHVLFTKGEHKAYVLEEALGHPVVNLEAAPITAECDVEVDCPFEHSSRHCSMRKALFYARWLQHHPDEVRLLFSNSLPVYSNPIS